MEKFLTFKYENIEITAQILSLEVKDNYNGMQNHVTGAYCQIMIKDQRKSELEGSPVYAFVSTTRFEFPPASPNNFVDIKDLDTRIFTDLICNAISDSPEFVEKIKYIGGCMGLCEAPQRNKTYSANILDKRKTNGGLEYNENGIAVMRV